ncbi:MAG TPA: hypothetical protein VN696_09625 [Pyrinomonadaceae bacterium]|nr:hypothetical protein [Pyrinomonadaceae bacterium]
MDSYRHSIHSTIADEDRPTLAEEELEVSSHKESMRTFRAAVISTMLGVGLSTVASVLSLFITTSKSRPLREIFSTGQWSSLITGRFLLLLGGLSLLAIITVVIASIVKLKNRDVILLKQRLAEIYSLALKNSALNPQRKDLHAQLNLYH